MTESVEERRSVGLIVGLGVAAALLATLLVVWLATRDDTTAVTVPTVVGQREGVATASLRNEGFQVSSVEEPSLVVPIGVVAAQSPAGGTTLDKNGVVVITVSTGPEPTVPAPAPPIIIQPNQPSPSTSSTSSSTSSTSTSTTSTTLAP